MRLSAVSTSRHGFFSELCRTHLLLVVLLIASVTFVACSDDPTSTGSELEPEPQPEEIDVVVEGVVTVEDSEESAEGAEVLVFRDDLDDAVGQASTGEEGAYEITFNVPEDDTPDELRLEVNAEGFEGYSDSFPFSTEVSRDVQLQAVTSEAVATGKVSDADSGDGIENATVTGVRTETGEQLFQVISDAAGDYEAVIEVAEEPGEVTITADAEDFESAEETVAFNEEMIVDLALDPSVMEATASGIVAKVRTNEGIEGATVTGLRTDNGMTLFEVTTDSDGGYTNTFEIADEPFEVTIIAAAAGFESVEETIPFTPEASIDFFLESAFISIGTIEELQKIGNEEGYPLDGRYSLNSDLFAQSTEEWNNGKGFSPIGDNISPFSGTLEGNGFRIFGLTIDRENENNVGLFGRSNQYSEVRNLEIVQIDLTGGSSVGGVSGHNKGKINNIKISGKVTGRFSVGGVAGQNFFSFPNFSEITNVHAEIEVRGLGRVGGLVGWSWSGRIFDSTFAGTVASDFTGSVGGLIGRMRAGIVENSYACVEVDGEGYEDIGGLVGEAISSINISNSYAIGSVVGGTRVGGFIGSLTEAGQFSDRGSVTVSYSAVNVSGDSDVAGFIAVNGGDLDGNYWDSDATDQEDGIGRGRSGGVFALTTDQMQGDAAEDNMEGFDFQEIWRTVIGGYPALQWEEQ